MYVILTNGVYSSLGKKRKCVELIKILNLPLNEWGESINGHFKFNVNQMQYITKCWLVFTPHYKSPNSIVSKRNDNGRDKQMLQHILTRRAISKQLNQVKAMIEPFKS